MEVEKVVVTPVAIRAFTTVFGNFRKWIEKMEIDQTIEMLEKHCLYGTTRIIRKVLNCK